jgi:Rad3-related DNA helicase
MMLAEAGTGVGKTLGYLAPASLWAEANGPSVWVSTYTRALQRQIERESHAVYPDPLVRARKAVVRKGRENYICLLNFQEAVQAAQLGNGDLIGLGLAARWVRATRDGDMTGGDFPAWLPGLFGLSPVAQASAAFIAVQTALNWVVSNYQHLAEWTASVNRVSALMLTWDRLDDAGKPQLRASVPAESRSARSDGEPAKG